MKRVSLLAAFCLTLVAFSANAGQVRIGYSCSNFNDIFQIYIVDAAREAAAEAGNVVLDVMDAQEDVIRQQDQVNTMIQKGIDVLVVVPVDTSAVQGIEAAAKAANLPLIYINRNPYPAENAPEGVYFIGANSIL
ncbi:MAG: substrate-binding domain-containing protein, partial [Planctomycetes bacterium]|nr:substrate-binding domain-containing protein [Planctomycetota bacterium]